jgi:hypothetical protein
MFFPADFADWFRRFSQKEGFNPKKLRKAAKKWAQSAGKNRSFSKAEMAADLHLIL